MENIANWNMDVWIAHLKHPMVLAGFALFVLVILLKPVFSNSHNKLSGRGTERLMSKALNYIFIIAILVIAIGFVLSLNKEGALSDFSKQPANRVEQTASGEGATAIQAGRDATINQGGTVSKTTRQANASVGSKEKQQNLPTTIIQKATGKDSTAISAGGDVNVNSK